MDSVAYLKRQHELKNDVVAALIASEIEDLRKQIAELQANQCKCPDVKDIQG